MLPQVLKRIDPLARQKPLINSLLVESRLIASVANLLSSITLQFNPKLGFFRRAFIKYPIRSLLSKVSSIDQSSGSVPVKCRIPVR